MPDDLDDQASGEHAQYIKERDGLIDAARESSRTFDQAVLAFGSAVFAASIAFLKDVAPHPQLYSLKWLGTSWALFSFGLLGVMLSFLFSHKACMFEIEVGAEGLGKDDYTPPKNIWSSITTCCNYLCVACLFVGLLSWSVFAFENLTTGENTLSDSKVPPPAPHKVEKGYTPPPPAPRTPPPAAPPSSPPTPVKK
jgi:hypothetical protein